MDGPAELQPAEVLVIHNGNSRDRVEMAVADDALLRSVVVVGRECWR